MKIKIEIGNGLVGCRRTFIEDFDEFDWDYMNDEEKEKCVLDIVLQNIEWNYEVVE